MPRSVSQLDAQSKGLALVMSLPKCNGIGHVVDYGPCTKHCMGRTTATLTRQAPKSLQELSDRTRGAQGSSAHPQNRKERTRSWDCQGDAVGQEQAAGTLGGAKAEQQILPSHTTHRGSPCRRDVMHGTAKPGSPADPPASSQHIDLCLFHCLCPTLHIFLTVIIKSFFHTPAWAVPVQCH